MRHDTLLAMLMFVLVAIAFVLVTTNAWRHDHEWYKYKVTVTEDNGVLYYGVETMDGEFIGEVPASKLDSLINNYNY
jgi:hypothetical protein